VLSKISVAGDDQHPLYAALTAEVPTADGKDAFRANLRSFDLDPTEDPDVLWNFEKFLIGKDGAVVSRFAPSVTPDDPNLVATVDTELSK
jgi:glutathione peroxidase